MKKVKKLVLLAISATMTASLFTGCGYSEKSLSDAFDKTQKITSSEFKTNMGLRLSAENLSAEEQQSANEAIKSLNGSKVEMQGKTLGNGQGTSVKMESTMKVKAMDKSFDFGLWIDADASEGKNDLKEIIKLPAEAVKENGGKQYFVLDTSKMPSGNKVNVDFNKSNLEFQEKLSKLLKDSMSSFKPGFNMVSSTGYSYIDSPDGRKLVRNVEVRLNDKQFKDLIKYSSNSLVKNKEAQKLMKEYVSTVAKMSAPSDAEATKAQTEIDKAFAEFDKGLPEFTDKMNKLFNSFDNVPLVGEKGIVFNYGIDGNGYIVSEKGNIDLVFDAPKFISTLDQFTGKPSNNKLTGVYKLGIDFDSTIYNINNSSIKVNLPEVNSKNSVQFDNLGKTAKQATKDTLARIN